MSKSIPIRSHPLPDGIKIQTVEKFSGHEPFTMVSNKLADEAMLLAGPAASGVLLYMLRKPTSWIFRFKKLMKDTGTGRVALRTILRKLDNLGYIRREQLRKSDGTFGDLLTYVSISNVQPAASNTPGFRLHSVNGPNPKKSPNKPVAHTYPSVSPLTVEPHAVNSTPYKEILVEIKNINNIDNNKYTDKFESKVSTLSFISHNIQGSHAVLDAHVCHEPYSFEEASISFDLGDKYTDSYPCEGFYNYEPLSSSQRPPESISDVKLLPINKNQGETMLIEAKECESKKSFDAEFSEFWIAYPKKKEKQKAKERYVKILKKDHGMHEIIMDGLRKQNEERQVSEGLGLWKPDPKWPAAWIKDARWEDETETEEQLNEKHIRSQQKHGGQYQRPESKYQRNSRLAHLHSRNANEQYRRALIDSGRSFEALSAELDGL